MSFCFSGYLCSCECGNDLFFSSSKFQHPSLLPSFSETIHKDSVSRHPEGSVWEWKV
uniref:L-methionine (R)-S-oxide reductase n=1 Tax=Cyprinodon variegatus TaxID=28743 RepID=A0A3Q2G9T6_CYPVA